MVLAARANPFVSDEQLASCVEVSLRQAQRYLRELVDVDYVSIRFNGRQREICINRDTILDAPLRKAAFAGLSLRTLIAAVGTYSNP